ncbi:hypothetical protein LCGC14_2260940 [marine sediment metagenome]|uniref:DUF115 domain-containing protein n=1 Tax=marine sediment metagenome TaxID=412755 RepID=A0A0F9FUS5_9ZZZZ
MRRNTTRTGLARRQRHQRFAIRSWVDRLPDTPAFIIGNGPSLNDQPVHLLKDYFSVGTNRCFHKFDPIVLLWQDISLWNTEYQKLHNTQALKVSRDVSDPRKIYYNFHLKGGGYKFDPSTTHILYGRGSTGPLAIQLAVAMGCRPIILLGMDCKLGTKGESDFYGENKYWTDATLKNCYEGLVFVKEQCPVEIYNCGDNMLWPKCSLEDVLKEIPDKHQRSRASYVAQILGLNRNT